ncbi:MAG: hypothetical protein AB7G93_18420 [Bdellovibrionales bacterium]
MSGLLETLDWRQPTSNHAQVIREHVQRVRNSARKLQCSVPEELVRHPEFYACLIRALKGHTSSLDPLLITLSAPCKYRLPNGAPVEIARGPVSDGRNVFHALLVAWEDLVVGNPKASLFVHDMIQLVICRWRPEIAGLFTSSQITHVGRVTLDNVLEAKTAQLIDGLVHESIHSYLYMVEERERFLATRLDPGVFVSSPWTGRNICLHSFVHACFVWFSLHTLRSSWQSPKEYRGKSFAEFVRRGFTRTEFTQILKTHRRWIPLHLEDLLLATRERALAA